MGGKLKNHKLLRNLKAAKCTGKKALMAAKICIDRFKKNILHPFPKCCHRMTIFWKRMKYYLGSVNNINAGIPSGQKKGSRKER
jgi:hypothetical protein